MIAITRGISDALAQCELTHLERVPIDPVRAREQHAQYTAALRSVGYEVVALPASDEFPDCVFVEDAAVAFPEIAVMTRPGAESRRGELGAVEEALAQHRTLARIVGPGTLDGGDVLVLGRNVYVGLSSRSDSDGVRQLGEILSPFDYAVHGIEVRGCLHLKTAATAIDATRALVNPEWIDTTLLKGVECIEVDPSEPDAANLVALTGATAGGMELPGTVLHGAAYPKTGARLRAVGLNVIEVPADELAKAEGALSCCSVLLH